MPGLNEVRYCIPLSGSVCQSPLGSGAPRGIVGTDYFQSWQGETCFVGSNSSERVMVMCPFVSFVVPW